MSHLHRFFAAPAGTSSDHILITGSEAHHALHVVRLRIGDEAAAIDGHGHEWRGRVIETTRDAITISIDSLQTVPEPLPRLTLCQAWLHRDKPIEEIIRMGTEIGVNRFVFFDAERSQRPVKHNPKWHRFAMESCKQCGRLWLPEFTTAQSLRQAFDLAEGRCFIAAKTGAPLSKIAPLAADSCTLIVGPEGDFTEADLATATERGATAVSLGGITYRAEVAALVLATLFKSRQGEFGPV